MAAFVLQVDDAEPVPLRVGKDDWVRLFRVQIPVDARGAETDKPLDLRCLIFGVEVEVDPWVLLQRALAEIERDARVRAAAMARIEDDERLVSRASRHVVERRAVEVACPNDVA